MLLACAVLSGGAERLQEEEPARDSEHPTVALGMAEVQALTAGLAPRSTDHTEFSSTSRTGAGPGGPSTLRTGDPLAPLTPVAPQDTLSGTDERPAVVMDFSDETMARPLDPDASSEFIDVDDMEVSDVVLDDDSVDVEEDDADATDAKPRSVPPPIPRN